MLTYICALQMNITFSCLCAVCWWQPEFRSVMPGRTGTKSVTKKSLHFISCSFIVLEMKDTNMS